MREIKCRAMDDRGNWHFGYYVAGYMFDEDRVAQDVPFIVSKQMRDYVRVKVETVGQFTGLKDKNSVDIYEGDIYKRYDNIYVVIFYGFGFKCKQVYDSWLDKNVYNRNEISFLSEVDSGYCYEVIGNIYENPELLEGAE